MNFESLPFKVSIDRQMVSLSSHLSWPFMITGWFKPIGSIYLTYSFYLITFVSRLDTLTTLNFERLSHIT